ncbi:MAG TPA: HNH endonuclease [Gaiellales bacterium]|jgi:5-methylcytosine-specific restriction endonuclease McrA
MTGQVLVLNATYEPLNVCSLRRACVLLLKAKAELVDALERPLRSASASLPYPVVIRLLSYVRRPRAAARRITRRAVFARDGHSCQYCGIEGVRLTVDHVLPRSRGGPSSWDNAVTACAPCNLRKGDRLPHEIGMRLRSKPRPPSPTLFLTLQTTEVPHAWLDYLPRQRVH